MNCKQCHKEIAKNPYCWDCFQGLWVKYINEAYMYPKYSEIMGAIMRLEEAQEKMIEEIAELKKTITENQ